MHMYRLETTKEVWPH